MTSSNLNYFLGPYVHIHGMSEWVGIKGFNIWILWGHSSVSSSW